MSSTIHYEFDMTPVSSPASPDWCPEGPEWSADWTELSPGSQYSSVSEMEEKLRTRWIIDEQAKTIRTLREEKAQLAMMREDESEENGARMRARENIIMNLRKEGDWMVNDLERARRNLPLAKMDPLEIVMRPQQEEELLLAYCSRSVVEKSTIEIQEDGREFLTLILVDNTTISGLMERNDGTPYDWLGAYDGNVWRGDRPKMQLRLGLLTIINLGGVLQIPPRMTDLLERSLENISGIYFVNMTGLGPIIRALEAAKKPYRNM